MTRQEEARLRDAEATIEKGMRTFTEVGKALADIRDHRLYRHTHGTFEDYCRDRWDFSRIRAHQLIEGSEVAAAVLTTVNTPVASERVARELVPLKDKPEELAAVWESVSSNGEKPTAERVRDAVRQHAASSAPVSESPTVSDRKVKQQQKLVRGLVTHAQGITELAPHTDFAVLAALPEEGKDEWKSQLAQARTVLSRVIAAL